MSVHFSVEKANAYLPHIVLIGLGIGTANYIIQDNLTWIQSCILSMTTSVLIGYQLVAIAANRAWFEHYINPSWKLYLILSIVFLLIGGITTEVEHLIWALVFSNEPYSIFSDGRMNVFNGIIALILGFSFFQNGNLFPKQEPTQEEENALPNQESEPKNNEEQISIITKLPVKQGEVIMLMPIEDIVYFEAFDNYAFVYDLKGEKRLCDYSLLFLQKRLEDNFKRVHRKYIVNTNHIKHIQLHSNSRYVIEFEAKKLSSIMSSKGYLNTIRKLIKIE